MKIKDSWYRTSKVIIIPLLVLLIWKSIEVISIAYWQSKGIYINALPSAVIMKKGYCKINDPIFVNKMGEWKVQTDTMSYPLLNFSYIEDLIVETATNDSSVYYKYKPKYHRDKFERHFEGIEADIISGDPNAIDYIDHFNGKYRYEGLKATGPAHVIGPTTREVRTEVMICNLRNEVDLFFARPSYDLWDTYVLDRYYISYSYPMIYIPFPISGKGYLFTGEILKDFNWLTTFFEDQNFYAVLAKVPYDIRNLGRIICIDKNGVLLDLEKDKTRRLKIELHHESNNIFNAQVEYNQTHSKPLITPSEFQDICNYSDCASVNLLDYDERIFVNMRNMLSKISVPLDSLPHWKIEATKYNDSL